MRISSQSLSASVIFSVSIFIGLAEVFLQSKTSCMAEPQSDTNQIKNLADDLNAANDYWAHNKQARTYLSNEDYANAIKEYKKAIDIIKKMPGDKWPNLKKEDAVRINQQTRIDSQIFSRYGLIEALEKAGKYEEAVQNVEWLMQNQQVKGKEELLKQKLDGIKSRLLAAKAAQEKAASGSSYSSE